jgi:hypothetical protein
MATEYMQATTEEARRALANKIADLRQAGVRWDGPGGIVARGLVSGATQGRKLLRHFRLDAHHGGPVEILASYDRNQINPKTGKPMGWRDPRRGRRP